jgi:hypothetical protein
MALEIDYQKSQLLVVNTYWPVAHETKSGLHTKLTKWLTTTKSDHTGTTLDFLKQGIHDYIYDFLKARGETGNIVLCGDLNSTSSMYDPGGHTNPALQEWLELSGLQDSIGKFLDTQRGLTIC